MLPALLYADRVTLICPESDDLLEMEDFGELHDSLWSEVELISMESGDAEGGPIYADLREALTERYAAAAAAALRAGDRQEAVDQVARIFALSYGPFEFDSEDRSGSWCRAR